MSKRNLFWIRFINPVTDEMTQSSTYMDAADAINTLKNSGRCGQVEVRGGTGVLAKMYPDGEFEIRSEWKIQ